jgi:glycosyltransferase involved in cell wall biosynthesis
MKRRLKILFVTPHSPLDQASGAQQRVLNIGKLLSCFGEVSYVIVRVFGPDDEETLRRAGRGINIRRIIYPLPVVQANCLDRVRTRIRYELDPSFLGTEHRKASEKDRNALIELMREHDLTWVHTIRTANLFGIDRWHDSVLDVDDLPSSLYASKARAGGILPRRLLDWRLSWIWRRREGLLSRRFDVLTVCSEEDRKRLGGLGPIHIIPNGFNTPATSSRIPSEPPRIGFIGLCDYRPNQEGVQWFIREAWPLIKREITRAELRLVGRDSDGALTKLGPDIVGLGWVEDPGDEIATWSAMIVPIRFGGGTRIKIVDGFARRCPVVATRMGAFGYAVRDGREILLADSAHDFASACVRLIRDLRLGEILSERAHQSFLQHWTWDSFHTHVEQVVNDCLAGSSPFSRRIEVVNEAQ